MPIRMGLLLLCFLGVAGTAVSQQESPSNDQEADVEAFWNRMVTATKAAQKLHIKGFMKTTFDPPNPLNGGGSIELRLQRPDKISVFYGSYPEDKKVGQLTVSDGKTLWRWNRFTQTYTKQSVKGPLEKILVDELETQEVALCLLGRNSYANALVPGPSRIKFDKVDGIEVEVLENEGKLENGTATVQVMIGKEDHLLRRIVREERRSNAATKNKWSIKTEIIYTIVNNAPTFQEKDFRFSPPPGAILESSPGQKKAPVRRSTKPRKK